MSPETPAADELGKLVGAVADRLRNLPESRLSGPAEAGHRLAQWLADAAGGIEQRASAHPPTARAVPRLGMFAAGDQVAVTGADLVAAVTGLDPAVGVWSPDGSRTPLAGVLTAAADALQELRRRC